MDIFKRPFSRKSMTPPASPGSQSKSNQTTKEDALPTKVEEEVMAAAVGALPTMAHENVTEAANEESATPSQSAASNADNGNPFPDIFPLPLPPTPNVSPIAAVSTTRECTCNQFCVNRCSNQSLLRTNLRVWREKNKTNK